jgi:hypothetical protein
MRTLIDAPGLIGGVLAAQIPFDLVFDASNLEHAATEDLGTVIAAAVAPASWKTDSSSEHDLLAIRRFQEIMATCHISRVILISSATVYSQWKGSDESTPVHRHGLNPYARHRLDLELWCRNRWPTTVIRLPHSFGGWGARRKPDYAAELAVLGTLHPFSTKQHYDLSRIGGDIAATLQADIDTVNLVPPPVTNARVLRDVLGIAPNPQLPTAPKVLRDIRTVHAEVFGGANGYIESADAELDRLRRAVSTEPPG